LTLLVEQLDPHLLAEVLERLARRPLVEDLAGVRPRLEVGVVGDAAFERDRLVLRPPEALANDGVPALLVLDDVRRAFDRRDLADARDRRRARAEEDQEAVRLVGIEPAGVDGERL